LFVGPTLLIPGVPQTGTAALIIMGFGQALRGFFDPFMMIPALPEMLDSVLPLYPKHMENEINDAASGIFNMFLGIGLVTGPLFGEFIYTHYSFQRSTDYLAITSLVFGCTYFIFGGGFEAYRKSSLKNHPVPMEYENDE
jgi:MFS family permease